MNPDKHIQIIREVVLKHLPGSNIRLFGSRAGDDYCDASDYDIMVITPQNLNHDQVSDYKSLIRKELANHLVPIDIIIVSKDQLPSISMLTNHIVNEAISTGLSI